MAKKKKKGKRRYRKSKKKSSGPKAKPAGLTAGAALTGFEIGMSRTPSGGLGPVDSLLYKDRSLVDNVKFAIEALKDNAVDPSKYKYALAGILITASPRIPLVGLVARPANKGLKRLTKGKWGL